MHTYKYKRLVYSQITLIEAKWILHIITYVDNHLRSNVNDKDKYGIVVLCSRCPCQAGCTEKDATNGIQDVVICHWKTCRLHSDAPSDSRGKVNDSVFDCGMGCILPTIITYFMFCSYQAFIDRSSDSINAVERLPCRII